MGCCGETTRVHSSQVNGRILPLDLENFDGPIRDRQCRDVAFLLLFAAFCGFLAYVLVIAGGKGEPGRLLYGCDSYGNVCGIQNKKIPDALFQEKTENQHRIFCTNLLEFLQEFVLKTVLQKSTRE
ncbi:choline transporter-like protein 1 isoform X2 [Tachypleus tridentatus]|uniref:choline transporter-like protein 1 isoform X2 n=1 Tax=Tachypleus tridentatus TaxID=6853 RepID=UPI003FD6832D